MWPIRALDIFYDSLLKAQRDLPEKPEVLKQVLDNMKGFTISTSFSGIDTPATSWLSLAQGITSTLEIPFEDATLPSNLYAVEWNRKCRVELEHHPHPPEHIFGDINHFWAPGMKNKVERLIEQNMYQEVVVPLVKAGKCVVRQAWCEKHQSWCKARHVITLMFHKPMY